MVHHTLSVMLASVVVNQNLSDIANRNEHYRIYCSTIAGDLISLLRCTEWTVNC